MNQPYGFGPEVDGRTVYVRSVATKDLPREVQDRIGGTATVFAVHSSEGERLALVRSRNVAFALARKNDLAPVSVH